MNKILKNANNWLLPLFLILFICEVIALPFAVRLAYAGRSEDPDHVLTYTDGKLTWNMVDSVDDDGVAELSVFRAEYEHVKSDDGDSVIAPGTEGLNIIRLKNDVNREITYRAVVYEIKSDADLPVLVTLKDGAYKDTTDYTLPENAKDAEVIRAVTGQVPANQIVDFDIAWLWEYYEDELQDEIDTAFGNKVAMGSPDDITVGVYIVVEDEGPAGGDTVIVNPERPKTGDNTMLNMYLVLMCISAASVIILFVTRKRGNE